MKLKELIQLHVENQLPEDLQKGWVYEPIDDGFIIHCHDRLGGLKYIHTDDPFTPMNGKEMRLYRLINGSEKEVFYHSDNFMTSYEKEIENSLSAYHVGLANHLLDVFGY